MLKNQSCLHNSNMIGTLNHHHHHHGLFSSWQHSLNRIKHDAFSAMLQEQQNAFIQRPTAEAYYSFQPPLEPLKLLLVGNVPNRTSHMPNKMKQLIKNFKKIEEIYDNNYDSSSFRPLSTETETLQRDKTIRSNVSKRTNSKTHSLRSRTRKQKREGAEIRQLLNQLIANLPITISSDIISETSIFQAPISQCSNSEDKLTTSAVGTLEGEEWMGGVRALRDSHVRLVQRQLRHIERLNRALDRVTGNFHKDPRPRNGYF